MIRTLTASMAAAAAIVLSLAQPGAAAELSGFRGGTCYSDTGHGCRPLRSANRVHVTYGPAVPMYRDERFYRVDQGPHPVPSRDIEPTVVYDPYIWGDDSLGHDGYAVGWGGYEPGFFYGGGPRRYHRVGHRPVIVNGHYGHHGYYRRAGRPAFRHAGAQASAGRVIHSGARRAPAMGGRAMPPRHR
jgi:hypothetical protein